MNISPTLNRTLRRVSFRAQKYSPALLTGAGVVALIGAGVLAAKATLNLEETLDAAENRMSRAKTVVEAGEADQKVIVQAQIKNVVEVGKLYWLPATLAISGTVLVLAGHHILNKRYAGMVVAYKGLETAFNNYRARVIEQYGEQVDKDIRYGLKQESIEDENGKKKKVTTVDRASTADYIFEFGSDNPNFVPNHEHNLFLLRSQQNVFNDILRGRSGNHVLLHEVLDALGIPRTTASLVTGWVYDPDNNYGENDTKRDNFISFGIEDQWEANGHILLDFNVDGYIADKL